MRVTERYKVPLNILVIGVSVVFVAAALVFGRTQLEESIELEVGRVAPQEFVATRTIEVVDVVATQEAQQAARDNTPTPFETIPGVSGEIRAEIAFFLQSIVDNSFEILEPTDVGNLTPPTTIDGVPDLGGDDTTTTLPEETTTTVPEDTSTTVPDEGAVGDETTTTLPEETTTTTTTQPPTTTTTIPEPVRRDIDDQIRDLNFEFARFRDVIPTWVVLYNHHLDLIDAGETGFWPILTAKINDRIDAELEQGIRGPRQLADVADRLAGDVTLLNVPGLVISEISDELLMEVSPDFSVNLISGSAALARVMSDALAENQQVDEEQWFFDQEEAADSVPDVTVQFFEGQTIVLEGQVIDSVALAAINELGLLEPPPGTSLAAVALLGGLTVLLAAFFLWRIAPNLWSEPKHFAILGILVGLAALVSRIPEVIVDVDTPELGFLIPVVIFGYAAAILYDPRTAVLLAVPVTVFTAISTGDIGLTIFAAAATVAPVSFVSAVSSRRQLRSAVAYSALVMAPLAFSVSWLFHGYSTAWRAALLGFVGGLVGGLVAQGIVSFLENLFRVTTTITLLDLTDRNHPALRHIEENAPGTFNHSILVGTLAGKAARAIGANPLLAQSAAYYHDLGKTAEPQYFIENQFGVSNPHNELDPVDSAKIIRSHVTEGVRLAREFRIPDEVADGIPQHHGTGLMRYFYHQALAADPGVDPKLFRHAGAKPKRKEMAILMLCDAVEGAARSLAQQEDPTAESLSKLVDSVVGEKVEDRQLDESNLTFGDLTKVKNAIVQALIGYYHTRIPYPGFPGPRAEDQ